jgi:hypothetical protein
MVRLQPDEVDRLDALIHRKSCAPARHLSQCRVHPLLGLARRPGGQLLQGVRSPELPDQVQTGPVSRAMGVAGIQRPAAALEPSRKERRDCVGRRVDGQRVCNAQEIAGRCRQSRERPACRVELLSRRGPAERIGRIPGSGVRRPRHRNATSPHRPHGDTLVRMATGRAACFPGDSCRFDIDPAAIQVWPLE